MADEAGRIATLEHRFAHLEEKLEELIDCRETGCQERVTTRELVIVNEDGCVVAHIQAEDGGGRLVLCDAIGKARALIHATSTDVAAQLRDCDGTLRMCAVATHGRSVLRLEVDGRSVTLAPDPAETGPGTPTHGE